MARVDLIKEELWHYLFDLEYVGSGSYGIVKRVDDNTCLKLYYKDFFEAFRTKDISKLDDEIDTIRLSKEERIQYSSNAKEIYENDLTKLELLIQMGYLKNILYYRGYKIGVEMRYYKDYLDLTLAVEKLNKEQIKIVIKQIREKLDQLLKMNIYPRDLSSSNIMVNVETLDVAFIDLDDMCTRYDTEEYLNSKPLVRECLLYDCNNSFNKIEYVYGK